LAQGGATETAAKSVAPPASSSNTGNNVIYMSYGDIKGDVTAKGFAGDARLSSLLWGVTRTIGSPTSSVRTGSTPIVSDIVIGKTFDSASVPLIQQAFGGSPTTVQTSFATNVNGVRTPYLTIKLNHTLVSSYFANSGGDLPSESLALSFTKITLTSTASNGQQETFTYAPTPGSTVSAASVGAASIPSTDTSKVGLLDFE
jgi:type VI secretion system secreted protein Hcp